MLQLYLKIWDWDLIFGAVKAISSLGVCSPWAIASEGIELIQSSGDIELSVIFRGLSQITFALRVGRWSEKRVVYYIKSAN